VIGELWLLLLLAFDLHANRGAFSDTVFAMFRLMIGATIALTLWYCWRTIGATIYWAVPPKPPRANARPPIVPLTKPSAAAIF